MPAFVGQRQRREAGSSAHADGQFGLAPRRRRRENGKRNSKDARTRQLFMVKSPRKQQRILADAPARAALLRRPAVQQFVELRALGRAWKDSRRNGFEQRSRSPCMALAVTAITANMSCRPRRRVPCCGYAALADDGQGPESRPCWASGQSIRTMSKAPLLARPPAPRCRRSAP